MEEEKGEKSALDNIISNIWLLETYCRHVVNLYKHT